ncbi:hypothetical protein D6810_03085 [Candidatus Dojkabacteria bacterium]|uniref:valine--tRNA ligase n=1 Tax=Candidatus Dojkabacteria bacterium TaxID=2099670 RepID=A0A3M0Z1A8_9BACT|nr:MAG: hypothetical protein D6810_03085 [Candidatus Dojkabacteria bacterium]
MALPDKQYDSRQVEPEVLRFWLESGAYKSSNDLTKDPWTLVCPPPNAYARPHIGNISGYGFQDAMARYQRMRNKNVLVLPGKDHAGLEGEAVFVREVLEKQGRSKFDMSREDFYSMMMDFFKKNMEMARTDEMKIGLSADFDKDTFTLDPDVVNIVLDTFIEMYRKGMIYKGVRIVNWDPKAKTAVADNQVSYVDAVTPFYYFKYSVGEPDLRALELKRRYAGNRVEWKSINCTSEKGLNLPYLAGKLNDIDVFGIGYEYKYQNEPSLFGKVIGVMMRIDKTPGLVVVNDEKTDILPSDQLKDVFLYESRFSAGSHIILFDQYPEDEYYKNGFIIGTVRPETIFADTAIACNPSDARYTKFIGKKIEVEFLGKKKKLSFISDYLVDKYFGTGLLKITPAHSNEDWEIAMRNKESCFPPVQVIGYDLKLNSLVGEDYAGLSIEEARRKLKRDMQLHGNLVWVDENYKNRIKISERTKAPIEPLLSSQWYLSYDVPVGKGGKTLRQAAIDMVVGVLEKRRIEQYEESRRNLDIDFIEPSQSDIDEMLKIFEEGIDSDSGLGKDNGIKMTDSSGKDLEIVYYASNIDLFKLKDNVSNIEIFCLLAKQRDKILGWVSGDVQEELKTVRNINIFVLKEFRSKNVDDLLMAEFIRRFGKDYNLETSIINQDRIINFFRKFGFTILPNLTTSEIAERDKIKMWRSANLGSDSVGLVHVHPENMIPKFIHWMENLRDWAISRSLWWGYRLPVWYNGRPIEKLDNDGMLREYLIKENGEEVLLDYSNEDHMRVQKDCPGVGWYQDECVLDTWFSSGQWVYAILQKHGLIKTRFPTDVLVSAHDILENWDSRMMMFSYFKHGKVPFRHLFLTGLVLGKDGQKMSKSRGNILDMDEITEKYGTDAVRLSFFYQNSAGSNYAITDDKLKNFKQYVNKIWNASKFVLKSFSDSTDQPFKKAVETLDFSKKLIDHIQSVRSNVVKNIESYEFGRATDTLYREFWHTFCDVFIEESKKYLNPTLDKKTKKILSYPDPAHKKEVSNLMVYVLKIYLKLLHPFIPFITQRIWFEVPLEGGETKIIFYSDI